ncbi:hypothetical protein CQW23_34512 [Capsicum baccatum]|uniref:Protein TAR1 n=1 Tax=Capsicum baccatum TaxID=33114 RepID=A0A2G2UZ09_CAPBA|nr:hypothetical protein CQW23_34512 [Capsicum baccatum]
MTNCVNQWFLSYLVELLLRHCHQYGKTNLSHDGLNPAHVPYWWVNNPTLGEFCFTMIGRADIEGSKSNVAMNAWLPQASYPCGNFSDTSSFEFRRSKGSLGHAFTMCRPSQTPHLTMSSARIVPQSEPWVQKEGQCPASDARNNRIPLVRTSSELAVRLAGKAPEGTVRSPSPGRHAVTRSRRGSSSSSPPTADGFGTWTPVPSPQSQSFSQTYGSILPTSLAYIVSSTRGCSPWRPDAVMSTTGYGRHSVLRIFKGRRESTGHHATCGALPSAGPYLQLSRFQGGQSRSERLSAKGSWSSDARRAVAAMAKRVELQPPLAATSVDVDSHLGQSQTRGAREASICPATTARPVIEARCEGATRCVTPRKTYPRPIGFRRNLRSKTRWFTGFCNSHQVSHFARFFIDARAEISIAESRLHLQKKHRSPRHTPQTGREGQAIDSSIPWRFLRRV